MTNLDLTTFIIPTIDRGTLQRAVDSVRDAEYLVGHDVERQGESYIRNLLIKEAKTPWVSFLDDDDTVTEDYVKRLQEEIEAHPEADLIVFRQYFISDLMDGDGKKYPDHFIWQVPVVHWGQVGISYSVKREVALEHPFKKEAHEDFHFVKRIEEAGYKIHFSPYITYRVRH